MLVVKANIVYKFLHMSDPFKRKTITASTITKSVCCSYDANFKLMAIKDAEKSNNCTVALKLHTVEQTVQQ